MPLTDTTIRTAKPGAKPVKLFDEGGLFLLVTPAGGKLWRLKYRRGGKEKLLALGAYPAVGLKLARQKRDEARALLAEGTDPGEARKAQKAAEAAKTANTLEAVGREWHTKMTPTWSEGHAAKVLSALARHIFPHLGDKPIAEITAPELLAVIRRIEARGTVDAAHRTLQFCGQIFRYGVATGRAERDPTGDLRGALPPTKGEHFAAITEPNDVAKLLRALDGYQGTLTVSCALRLAPLVFVRPGELRKAQWADIDLDAAEWRYTVTKTGTPHIVPLAIQAVAILKELHPLTGGGCYVFPNVYNAARPMSDNTVLAALRNLGFTSDEMTGHGFRAMARTLLDEVLGYPAHLIEHQLAHAVRDPNGRAYNRTAHLPERRAMMQAWADHLDKLKAGATIIPFHRAAA